MARGNAQVTHGATAALRQRVAKALQQRLVAAALLLAAQLHHLQQPNLSSETIGSSLVLHLHIRVHHVLLSYVKERINGVNPTWTLAEAVQSWHATRVLVSCSWYTHTLLLHAMPTHRSCHSSIRSCVLCTQHVPHRLSGKRRA